MKVELTVNDRLYFYLGGREKLATNWKTFISLLLIGGQEKLIEVGTWGGGMQGYGSLDSPLEVTFTDVLHIFSFLLCSNFWFERDHVHIRIQQVPSQSQWMELEVLSNGNSMSNQIHMYLTLEQYFITWSESRSSLWWQSTSSDPPHHKGQGQDHKNHFSPVWK